MNFWLEQAENELKLLNYSRMTIKNYLRCLREYFSFSNCIQTLNKDIIKKFLLEKLEAGKSAQTVNLYLNAITFFYRYVLKNNERIGLKFAKKPKRLPVVLNRDEIQRIVATIINRKHRLMIFLAYSAGLRVAEVVNLQVRDVQIENLVLHIKQSKGNRDRLTIFSEKLRADIVQSMAGKKPDEYLFESGRGGKLTTRTAQKVFENAMKKTGIFKTATFHSLRHSFATHLMEDGVNIRYVQELLGHRNIQTTQIYTQVAMPALIKIKSPL